MDPNSGKIYDLNELGMSDEEAQKKGLVHIPSEEREKVQAMNRHERRKWAAEQRKRGFALDVPMHEALFPNAKIGVGATVRELGVTRGAPGSPERAAQVAAIMAELDARGAFESDDDDP